MHIEDPTKLKRAGLVCTCWYTIWRSKSRGEVAWLEYNLIFFLKDLAIDWSSVPDLCTLSWVLLNILQILVESRSIKIKHWGIWPFVGDGNFLFFGQTFSLFHKRLALSSVIELVASSRPDFGRSVLQFDFSRLRRQVWNRDRRHSSDYYLHSLPRTVEAYTVHLQRSDAQQHRNPFLPSLGGQPRGIMQSGFIDENAVSVSNFPKSKA